MLNVLLLLLFLSFIGVGCNTGGGGVAPPPPAIPNLYQSPTVSLNCQEEVEYRWKTTTGELKNDFHPVQGNFCIHIDKATNGLVESRCVTRAPNGMTIPTSNWVKAVIATSLEEFQKLCNQAE